MLIYEAARSEIAIARLLLPHYGLRHVAMQTTRCCAAVTAGIILAAFAILGVAVAAPVNLPPVPELAPPATNHPVGPPMIFGAVHLDKELRALSFPALVNQRTGVVEYAVVAAGGKTHESIFRTEAQPAHIHIAMLLLGVNPAYTNRFPADPKSPPPGPSIWVEVSWREGEKVVRHAMEDLIVAGQARRALPAGPWAYNGSYLARKNFVAQRDGSVVSLHIDPDALVNNPRPGREDDDAHVINTVLLPPDKTPVEVTFRMRPVDRTDAEKPKPNSF